jgi:hypothetical protein
MGPRIADDKGGHSVDQLERRTSRRFLLRLPLTARWIDGTLRRETLTETRQVSSGGVRFVLPKAPKNSSTVEILMTFPNQLTHARRVGVLCHGHVMRTSLERSDEIEVIACIKRFKFIREAEGAA